MYQKSQDLWPREACPAPAYCGEDERLSVLAAYAPEKLTGDPELEAIIQFAAKLCDVPIATVSIVERDRQNFLVRKGLEQTETSRPSSFCAKAMLYDVAMVVADAREDARFTDNPFVTGPPHIRFYAGMPLISEEGAPLGALCVIDDKPRPQGLTEMQREGLLVLADAVMRRLAHQRQGLKAISEIAAREARLRSIIDSVPGIAWSADAAGNFDYFNARWRDATGAPEPRNLEEWREYIHPDDFETAAEKFTAAVAAGEPYEGEARLRLADGSYRWILSHAVPTGDGTQDVRWFGTITDNDEAHRLAESRDLMARELSHRIKNIFAVVGGLISIRARGKPEVSEFAAELSGAVRALGTAHDYVRPMDQRSNEHLIGLLEDLLKPYDDADGTRFSITGTDIAIGARAATPLALIFHELATNSAKYGALSDARGDVSVEVIAPCDDGETVCVRWDENGLTDLVPANDPHEGFGSRLLRMAIENQLGGSFTRSFGHDGLEIEIRFPMARIAD